MTYQRKEQIGDCTLYLGDCWKVLPALGKVDHVISDPPYGDMTTHKRHLSTVALCDGNPARQSLGFDGITLCECLDMARQWCDVAQRWVVFTCEWQYMHALSAAGILVRFGIWRKPDGAPQFTGDRPGTGWEAVAVCAAPGRGRKRWNGGGKHGFWQHAKGGNRSGHPTGKPIGLYRDFVSDFTDPGDVVLDPFMGSGTTGVACVQLGRKFIGVEVDLDSFNIACGRIDKAERQPDMFIEQPEQVALL